jgi:hypothetical protein
LVRSQTLYPTELRGRNKASFTTIYLSLHLARLAALAAPQFSTPQQIFTFAPTAALHDHNCCGYLLRCSCDCVAVSPVLVFRFWIFRRHLALESQLVIAGKLGCAGAGASDSAKFSVATNTTNC